MFSIRWVPLFTVALVTDAAPCSVVAGVLVPPFHAAFDTDSVQSGTAFVDHAVSAMWCVVCALDCLTHLLVPFVTEAYPSGAFGTNGSWLALALPLVKPRS